VAGRVPEQSRRHEPVVQYDVRRAQTLQTAHADQARIARARANDVDEGSYSHETGPRTEVKG
jgi:hypothetical protein